MKAKTVLTEIADSNTLKIGGVIAAFLFLFWIIGKAGNALEHRVVASALRFIITVLVLFYVFGSYFFARLREGVIGAKEQIEERDEKMSKGINELFPELHK